MVFFTYHHWTDFVLIFLSIHTFEFVGAICSHHKKEQGENQWAAVSPHMVYTHRYWKWTESSGDTEGVKGLGLRANNISAL